MNIESEIVKIPFWNDLTNVEKSIMKKAATVRKYEKDQMIYGFSDACLGLINVKKGSIRVYTTSEDGREITFFHIEEGEWCILSAACAIGQVALDVQLTADRETELLAIHSGTVAQIIEQNIYAKSFVLELSTSRLSSVVWVMQEILFAHFDERLARFLLNEYEKTGNAKIKMTQEHIAKEVNSAREVVARMLKQFAGDGLIAISRGVITITDVQALKKLVR